MLNLLPEGYLDDSLPVMGANPSVSGLYYAFGFSGHGFQVDPGSPRQASFDGVHDGVVRLLVDGRAQLETVRNLFAALPDHLREP